ncbi:MAG: hypothetical protein ACT4O4_08940 [Nitrospiraceae bacterium]
MEVGVKAVAKSGSRNPGYGRQRKEWRVEQRYAITVKFLVDGDSAEDAEEMVETACEKAAASFPEMSYEGIEDIEEEEEE